MATLQHNITTVLTQDLLTAGDNISDVKHISITNVVDDSSAKAQINLFLNKGDKNFHILKNFKLQFGSTLILSEEDGIRFDNTSNGFSLRIQVDNGGSSPSAVDVIITRLT